MTEAKLRTARELADKAGVTPQVLRRLLRKESNRAGKTLCDGNRAEYRFDPSSPATKEIIAKAKEVSEKPKVTDTKVQPEPENSKANSGNQTSPKLLVAGSNPAAATLFEVDWGQN